MKKNKDTHFNQRVAKNRGVSWRNKLAVGKLSHLESPSQLRRKRVKAGFSQSQFAEKMRLTAATYGEIERGKRAVKEPVAQEISRELKSSLSKLFTPHSRFKKKFIAIRV